MRNSTYNAFSLSFYQSNSLFLYYQSIRTFFQKKINSDGKTLVLYEVLKVYII